MRTMGAVRVIAVVWAALSLAACAALTPKPVDLDARIAAFPNESVPLDHRVVVRWNERHIPYIDAKTDHDAAFALGMVQAHLRGGQLALIKRIVRGRLAEIGGPALVDYDHALRILDFGHAAGEAFRAMPPQTQAWLQAFVDGLNWYEDTAGIDFPESGLMGLVREPYIVEDMIAIARLGGTDVNWPLYLDLLAHWGNPDFADAFARVFSAGGDGQESFDGGSARVAFLSLLRSAGRWGSNAYAVMPSRSSTGAALIACDPHLPLTLPNIWMIVGVNAPSLHAVGLMPVGLPVIAIGRSAFMGWGGTNMHAATSDLYDVSGLPAGDFVSEQTTIRTRLWPDAERTVRRTPLGPVISDAALLEIEDREIALRWMGHAPTDEFTPLLDAARARTPEEFRAAFRSFGQPPQNMVFATADGHIGQIMATVLPDRTAFTPETFVRDGSVHDPAWDRFADSTTLPWIVDPPGGVVASANNKPASSPVPIGFTFGDDERVRRILDLLGAHANVSPEDLMRFQRDTMSSKAAAIAHGLVAEIDALGLQDAAPGVVARLRAWKGDYAADSAGPPAFEALLYRLLPPLYGARDAASVDPLRKEWETITAYFLSDLRTLPVARRATLLREALSLAERDVRGVATWGDIHRMPIRHMLSLLPILGGYFDYGSYAVGGSRQTPMKTSHGLLNGRGFVDQGSDARFVADMGNPDANWFALFGGEDGWLGSSTFMDQIDLWRRGEYVQMPLGMDEVARSFPIVTVLYPPGSHPETDFAVVLPR